jgi:hypothetical protein
MSVVRTVEVDVDPATAFRMFTEEIDDWYERGPYSFNDPERAVAIRLEGGRLLELYAEGEPYEMGRVTVWEPGERLVFLYRNVHLPLEGTEVEVRFEPKAPGTRVALEHADDAGAYLLARKALTIDPENEAAQRLVTRLDEVMRTRGETVPDAPDEPNAGPARPSAAASSRTAEVRRRRSLLDRLRRR